MMFRQGDVLIKRIEKLPEELVTIAPEAKGLVLAHGEVTGHAHAVADTNAAKLFWNKALTQMFLLVETPTEVSHDEHSAIALEPGVYEVIRQREYSYWDDKVRQVVD